MYGVSARGRNGKLRPRPRRVNSPERGRATSAGAVESIAAVDALWPPPGCRVPGAPGVERLMSCSAHVPPLARYPFSRIALVRNFPRRRSAFESQVAIPACCVPVQEVPECNWRHRAAFLPSAVQATIPVDQMDDPKT